MTSSLAFLGSKTGKEVGVCFWRVHRSLPRFTVVFKRVEERDSWCDSSQLLRDMVRSEGVRASRVFYDRELDQVVGGDGEREREGPAKMRSDGNNNTVVGRKSESIKTFMMDELQDLDDIFLGNSTKGSSPPAGGVEAGSEVGHGAQDGDRQSPVSSGFGSSESDGGSTKDQNQSDPPPPPPLRLPKFVQKLRGRGARSKLLERLVSALEIYVMGSEIGLEGRQSGVAQAVADSWQEDLPELEKLYEQFLTDLTMNRYNLNQQLANISSFPGSSTVTRAKAIQLTELFIVNAGTRVGMDLDQSFHEFISDNISRYQISKEEMLFIATRNKLDLTSFFKSFQVSPNMSSFRKLLNDQVNLSGSFFQDFSQVLIDFFLSKAKGGGREGQAVGAKGWGDRPYWEVKSGMLFSPIVILTDFY